MKMCLTTLNCRYHWTLYREDEQYCWQAWDAASQQIYLSDTFSDYLAAIVARPDLRAELELSEPNC